MPCKSRRFVLLCRCCCFCNGGGGDVGVSDIQKALQVQKVRPPMLVLSLLWWWW